MIKIKLFGSLRLKCGLSSMDVYAKNIREAVRLLSKATGFPEKEFRNCTFMVNGKHASYFTKLKSGDELVFMSPSGGG